MSAGLILQYLFPTILLPAMAAFPFAVAGKSLDAGGKDRHVLCVPRMKTRLFRAGVEVAPALSP